jgi:hypothetical protein
MKPFSIWVRQRKPKLLCTEGGQPPLRPARLPEEGERGAGADGATLKRREEREREEERK